MSLVKETRNLIRTYYPNATFIEEPAVDEAIIGISDGRVVYSYDDMINLIVKELVDLDISKGGIKGNVDYSYRAIILVERSIKPQLATQYKEYTKNLKNTLNGLENNVLTATDEEFDNVFEILNGHAPSTSKNKKIKKELDSVVDSLRTIVPPPMIIEDSYIRLPYYLTELVKYRKAMNANSLIDYEKYDDEDSFIFNPWEIMSSDDFEYDPSMYETNE